MPTSVGSHSSKISDKHRTSHVVSAALTEQRLGDNDAILGGLGSTDGNASMDALRCEIVILPFELVHMITIGTPTIPEPNPLQRSTRQWPKPQITNLWPIHSHPAGILLPGALQDV